MPSGLGDSLYDVVPNNRYDWFGQKGQCMIPDEVCQFGEDHIRPSVWPQKRLSFLSPEKRVHRGAGSHFRS